MNTTGIDREEFEKLPLDIRQQLIALDQFAIVSFADQAGNITYVNDLFCTVSEYSRNELLGKNHRILKSGLQPDSLFKDLWKNVTAGKVWKGEVLNKKKNGGYYWVDTTIVPFKKEDGSFDKYVSIRIDITKQKEQLIQIESLAKTVRKSKEELDNLNRKLHHKYKSVLENMNDAFILNDLSGKIIFANKRFFEIFNHREPDSGGKRLQDFVLPQCRNLIENNHLKVCNGNEVNDIFEATAQKCDGTLICLEMRVTATLEERNIMGSQFIVRDISERKRIETERLRLAELNRKIIESSDELFYVLDVLNSDSFKNPVKFVSPQVNIILGVSESDILDKQNRWHDFIHPDDLNKVKEAMYDMFLSRKPVMVCYRVMNQIMNEYVWVDDYASPHVNSENKIVEIYGSLKDVTGRILAGEKIEQEQTLTTEFQYQLLCSQLNPHFIYNTLNSFQYYILNGKIEDSLCHIADFSNLMRSVLENSTHKHIPLKDEISFVEQYIKVSRQRMNKELQFEVNVSKGIHIARHHIPPMLLQPYIENAIIHAFGNSPRTPELRVTFTKSGNRIYCSISDNGMGRKDSREVKSEMAGEKKSHAMRINQTRINLLNQIHSKNYQLEVIDLKDENAKPSGTRIIVSYDEILENEQTR